MYQVILNYTTVINFTCASFKIKTRLYIGGLITSRRTKFRSDIASRKLYNYEIFNETYIKKENLNRDNLSSGIISSRIITSTIFRRGSLSLRADSGRRISPRKEELPRVLYHAVFVETGFSCSLCANLPHTATSLLHSLNPFYSRFILLSVPHLSTTTYVAPSVAT